MELINHKKVASINLLKDEEQVISTSQKKLGVTISIVLFAIVFVLSIGIFSYSLLQKNRLNTLKSDLQTKITTWQALESVGTSVKNVTAKNEVVTQTQTKYSGIDNKLNKIRELLPEGTSLSTLTIDSTGKVVISGKATSADIVYQFYEVLKKESEVSAVSLNSLAKTSTDYTFNITLTLSTK